MFRAIMYDSTLVRIVTLMLKLGSLRRQFFRSGCFLVALRLFLDDGGESIQAARNGGRGMTTPRFQVKVLARLGCGLVHILLSSWRWRVLLKFLAKAGLSARLSRRELAGAMRALDPLACHAVPVEWLLTHVINKGEDEVRGSACWASSLFVFLSASLICPPP